MIQLTNNDWEQIRLIALELLDKGYHDKDQFKIAVTAYLTWYGAFRKPTEESLTEPLSLTH